MLRESISIRRSRKSTLGFSLMELVVVVAIGLVLAAISVPAVRSAVASYKLRSGQNAITGVIQSTRYRAIYQGYPFRVAFTKATSSYQLTSKPAAAASYTNVGGAVPFGDSSVQISQDTTFQFNPSGAVTVITGASTFTLTNGGNTKNIAVSTYGNVKVY